MFYVKNKSYSLARHLLSESIITNTEFFTGIYNYCANKNLDSMPLAKAIVGIMNKQSYFSADKSQKKKYDLQIVSYINSNFVSPTGESLNIKEFINLHNSILEFLKVKSDTNLDDCLIAAHTFVKTYINALSESEMSAFQKGKLDFALVFKKIDYYRRYFEENREVFNIIGDEDLIDYESKRFGKNLIYDEDGIKVYFPRTPKSFRKVIKEKGLNLDWCTQKDPEWYNYNTDQKLCILINENLKNTDRLYIISMKVLEKDGTYDNFIDYNKSCDLNNKYMSKFDFDFLSSEVEQKILSAIKEEEPISTSLLKPKEEIEFFNKMADLKKYKTCNSYLTYCFSNIGDRWDELSNRINSFYINFFLNDRSKKAIDILSDVISDYCYQKLSGGYDDKLFDVFDTLVSTNVEIEKSKFLKLLFDNILEKSKNRRLHEKYGITIASGIHRFAKNEIDYFDINEADAKMLVISTLSTNNINNFKLSLYAFQNTMFENIQYYIKTQDFYDELIQLNIFKKYVNVKKHDVFSVVESGIDAIINNAIRANKEKFIEIYNEVNEEQINKSFFDYWRFKLEFFAYLKLLAIDVSVDKYERIKAKEQEIIETILDSKKFYYLLKNQQSTSIMILNRFINLNFIENLKNRLEMFQNTNIAKTINIAILALAESSSNISFDLHRLIKVYKNFADTKTIINSISLDIKNIIIEKIKAIKNDSMLFEDEYSLNYLFLIDNGSHQEFNDNLMFGILSQEDLAFMFQDLSIAKYFTIEEVAEIYKRHNFFERLDTNFILNMDLISLKNFIDNFIFLTSSFKHEINSDLYINLIDAYIKLSVSETGEVGNISQLVLSIKPTKINFIKLINILSISKIRSMPSINTVKYLISIIAGFCAMSNKINLGLDKDYLFDIVKIYDYFPSIIIKRDTRKIILNSSSLDIENMRNCLIAIVKNISLSANIEEIEQFAETLEREDVSSLLLDFTSY